MVGHDLHAAHALPVVVALGLAPEVGRLTLERAEAGDDWRSTGDGEVTRRGQGHEREHAQFASVRRRSLACRGRQQRSPLRGGHGGHLQNSRGDTNFGDTPDGALPSALRVWGNLTDTGGGGGDVKTPKANNTRRLKEWGSSEARTDQHDNSNLVNNNDKSCHYTRDPRAAVSPWTKQNARRPAAFNPPPPSPSLPPLSPHRPIHHPLQFHLC